jgi:tetratricopeptide (TPR) repeat protein
MQVRGQNEQVLEEFKSLRGQLEELSEQSEKQELANSWNVHEVLLGVSATAAMELKDWDYALELIADVRKGHRERGAPPVVQAMVEFNRFGPLRHLKRFSEAESMLKEVRRTLEDAGEFRRLGQVFDAWAILEHERGHFDAALEAGRKALHLYYMYTEPISISGSHNNFAGHLDFGEGNPQEIVAHLLAAALIRRQTGSGDYRGPLVALVQSLKRFGPEVLPDSFEELCGFIGQVENIDFAALFALLPNSTSNGDAVLAAVIEEARELLRVYEKSLADPERPVGSQ